MVPIQFSKNSNMTQVRSDSVSKKALYLELASKYFLPPKDSKGVSVKYLKKVQAGLVFRVETMELNKFLAGLVLSQTVKTPFTSKFLAYSKIDRLLLESGRPGLGFEQGIMPDGEWLYRVARFVDRGNLAEIFESPVPLYPQLECDSSKIKAAKKAMERDLLTDSGVDKAETVQDSVAALKASWQKYVGRKAELENLLFYGKQLTRQVEADKREVEQLLIATTLAVYSVGMHQKPEEVLLETDPKLQELHKR